MWPDTEVIIFQRWRKASTQDSTGVTLGISLWLSLSGPARESGWRQSTSNLMELERISREEWEKSAQIQV